MYVLTNVPDNHFGIGLENVSGLFSHSSRFVLKKSLYPEGSSESKAQSKLTIRTKRIKSCMALFCTSLSHVY